MIETALVEFAGLRIHVGSLVRVRVALDVRNAFNTLR